MQGGFSIQKSIILNHNIIRLKKKIHTIISIDPEKGIRQNSTPIHDKKKTVYNEYSGTSLT